MLIEASSEKSVPNIIIFKGLSSGLENVTLEYTKVFDYETYHK